MTQTKIKKKTTSADNYRVNLSFTKDEFNCINTNANDLDLSMSSFMYANMKVSAQVCSILGDEQVKLKLLTIFDNIIDEYRKKLKEAIEKKEHFDYNEFEKFVEIKKNIIDFVDTAEALKTFSDEWLILRMFK